MRINHWLLGLTTGLSRLAQRRRRRDLRRAARGMRRAEVSAAVDPLEARCLLTVTTVELGFFTPETIGASDELVLNGSGFRDTITLQKAGPGFMQVTYVEGSGEKTVTFPNPSSSLTINGNRGADTINVRSLDPDFAAELYLYGKDGSAPDVVPDIATDAINFLGDINTNGAYLEAFAESINVDDGVTLTTSGPAVLFDPATAVDLNANTINVDFEHPFAVGDEVRYSHVRGNNIGGEDFTFNPTAPGTVDKMSGLITLSAGHPFGGDELVTYSSGGGTSIGGLVDGEVVRLISDREQREPNTSCKWSVHAISKAEIDVGENVEIFGGGAVNLTSSGSASATISATTSRNLGKLPQDNSKQGAVALAISNAEVESKATVAKTATIHAGTTLDVRALGDHTSEAESETGLFSNGSAGLALAFQFSDSDVTAEIHGTMTADMNHPDGAVVKLEFDPTTQIDFANDTINAGSNWVVVTEDTVSYQNRRGATSGGLTSGQDYYIIRVLDKPSTPDIDESNGGANVRLAETEQKAIDGGLWELDETQTGRNPFAVDLSGGGTLNTRRFNSDDVNATNNTISIDPDLGPFELGQSVIYREDDLSPTDVIVEDGNGGYVFADADGNPLRDANGNLIPHTPAIPGLIHNTIYWTLASPNQFGLQGDSRIVVRQVLQLGALENEVRGGNIIEIGTPTPGKGFSLNGVQVLDSNLLTFGVVTSIDATDSATASAGLSSATDFASTDPPGASEIVSLVFGEAFGKLAAKFQSKADEAKSEVKSNDTSAKLSVAGALAFSFTDHDAFTHIMGTADLNSNDDMELTSAITQSLQLGAEATNEPQDNEGKFKPGASAATTVSTAVIIGEENNSSRAIVETGAKLDSMRALRLLSGVSYPFLTRPDQFFPVSATELTDKLKNEGYDGVNGYLDGTLGLQSNLLNTWARSISKADETAIAGSVNLLLFDNVSESIVRSGVEINQDPFYRPDQDDPADNDNVTHSANANNLDEHVVSIEAQNYMQFFNMTGVFDFDLPYLNLTPGETEYSLDRDISAVGSAAKRGGVGGAIFLSFLDNTTHAIIEDGVDVYSGTNKGLNLKAEEAILSFAFTQAGGAAGEYGVGGSFSYSQQDSDILAHIGSGVTVEGGRVDVYAGSLETMITWVGGVSKSMAFGLGAAVGANNVRRKTRAVIGDLTLIDDPDAISTATQTTVDADRDVRVRSKIDGQIWAFTVAGTVVNSRPQPPAPEDPLDGTSLASLFGEPDAIPANMAAKSGIGVAAAAGIINEISNAVTAAIENSDDVNITDNITITADEDATTATANSTGSTTSEILNGTTLRQQEIEASEADSKRLGRGGVITARRHPSAILKVS